MSDNNNNNTLTFDNGTVVITLSSGDGDNVQMRLFHFFNGKVAEDETQLFLNVLARGLMVLCNDQTEDVIAIGQETLQEQFKAAAEASQNVAPIIHGVDTATILEDYTPVGRAN